jgi:hypothetical protein
MAINVKQETEGKENGDRRKGDRRPETEDRRIVIRL